MSVETSKRGVVKTYSLGRSVLDGLEVKQCQSPDGEPLPSLHSAKYLPLLEPSLETGVLSMTTAVLNLIGK